jgi:hypothetical protein
MEVVVCRGELRRSRYAVVTRFVTRSDVQFAEARMNTGVGERGRNRTFNLLIPNQQTKNKWFQRFPKHFSEHK